MPVELKNTELQTPCTDTTQLSSSRFPHEVTGDAGIIDPKNIIAQFATNHSHHLARPKPLDSMRGAVLLLLVAWRRLEW